MTTTQHNRLIFASIFFAVFWTAAMYWSNAYGDTAPMGVAGTIILMITGALAGYLWYLGMRWWMRRMQPK